MKPRHIFLLLGIFVYLFCIFDTGFNGPDDPIYFAYTASAVEDGDLNVVNQLYPPGADCFISPTFNFPDFHNHATVIFRAPFYLYAKTINFFVETFKAHKVSRWNFDRSSRLLLSFNTFLIGLFTLFFSYLLCRAFFGRRISLLSVAALFLGAQFFYYMLLDVANANIPTAFCSVLSILFLVYLSREKVCPWSRLHWFLYGVFFSICLTIKTELWFQFIFIVPVLSYLCFKKITRWSVWAYFAMGLVPVTLLRGLNAYLKYGVLHLEEIIYLDSSLRYKASYCFDGLFSAYRGIVHTSPILLFCLGGLILALIRLWPRGSRVDTKFQDNFILTWLGLYALVKTLLIGRIFSPGGDSLSLRLLLAEFPVFVLLFANFIQWRRRWLGVLMCISAFFILWHLLIVSEHIAGLDWFYITGQAPLILRGQVLKYFSGFFLLPHETGFKLAVCGLPLLFFAGIGYFVRRWYLKTSPAKPPLFYVRYLLYGITLYAFAAYSILTASNLWNNQRNVAKLKKQGFFSQAKLIRIDPFKMNILEEEEHLWTVFEMQRYNALKDSPEELRSLKNFRQKQFGLRECEFTLFPQPVQPYLRIADRHKLAGRYREAISLYEEALALVPYDLDALLSVGDLYMLSGNYPKAVAVYTQALKVNPASANASCRLADAYNKTEELDNAVTYYQKCSQLNPKSAEAYYSLAWIYRARADYPKAIACFRKIIELNPDSADAYSNLGSLYQAQASFPQAIEYFEKSIRLNPNSADVYSALGAVYQAQGDYPKAITCFGRVIRLNPDSTDAYSNLGTIYRAQAKYPQAIACFEKIIRLNPKVIEPYFGLGSIYQDQTNYRQAISCFEKILRLNPNFADAYSSLGSIYTAQNNYAKAIDCYEHYLRLRPGSVEVYASLGTIYQDQGKYPQAIACFEKITQLSPGSADAYINLVSIYQSQADYPKAIACFEKIIQLKPRSVDAYFSLGEIYQEQADYPQAIACFEKIIQLNPESSDAYSRLGAIYLAQADYPRAISYFEKIIQFDPGSVDAYNDLASIYLARADYPRAISYFEKIIQLNPRSTETYFNLASIYQEQANYPKAIANLEKVIGLNPGSTDAYGRLGEIYQEQANYPKAIACFQKIIQLNPRIIDPYYGLGSIYQVQADYPKAIACFQKIIQLNPGSADAHLNLGFTYKAQGSYDKAISHFLRYLRMRSGSDELYSALVEMYMHKGDKPSALKLIKQLKAAGRNARAQELERDIAD